MSVDFQIVNQKGKIINITATVDDDGKLYRCGKLIYCNCDKTNPEPYKYNKEYNEVYCPKCNKKSLHTIKNEGSNIHLDYIGLDENTMQKLYRLSDTLNHDTWLSVSEYFVKLSADDVDLNTNVSHVGWVTSNPEAVEDKLNIMQEWRMEKMIKKKFERQFDDWKYFLVVDIFNDEGIARLEIVEQNEELKKRKKFWRGECPLSVQLNK